MPAPCAAGACSATCCLSPVQNTRVQASMDLLPDQHGVPLLTHIAALLLQAELKLRRLGTPRAGMEYIEAACGPPLVKKHASGHARIPLLVQKLQRHVIILFRAIFCEEGLLRHLVMVPLLPECTHQVLQPHFRRSDYHQASIEKAFVAIAHGAKLCIAFLEHRFGVLTVQIPHHVYIRHRDVGVVRQIPDRELVHDPRPPFVNNGVRVH
mmetsp:Transcript_61084/g.131387  ORF Transcript_61084/g.131387 Transcript_61084/m.131387 type:complete len:210 (-) Transcript_61084:855-1484(-)